MRAEEGLEELFHVQGQEGGGEEIPLIRGKEQQLCFAGAAVKCNGIIDPYVGKGAVVEPKLISCKVIIYAAVTKKLVRKLGGYGA